MCKGKKARKGMVSLTPDTGDQKPPRPPLVQSPGDTPHRGATHLSCLHLHHPPGAADARLGQERALLWNLAPHRARPGLSLAMC